MFTTFFRSAPIFARTAQRRAFSSNNANTTALVSTVVTAGVGAGAVYYLIGQNEATEKKLLGKIDDLQVALSGKTNRYLSI